jgi:hypothetical protein
MAALLVLRWPVAVRVAERLMAYTMHVFVTAHRGAAMKDLGVISVSPKPVRSEMVHFLYKGRPVAGMVALIDPYNWEKRPGVITRIHVHMSEGD